MKKIAKPLNPLCNHAIAVAFVKEHLADAAKLAALLDVPTENMLGLAAQESQWGVGRIGKTYNNYFSMHAPAPQQKGDAPALGNPSVRVATYDSFYGGGLSFIARFGDGVRGIKDPAMFAKGLVKARFNSGNSKTGGRDDFVPYLVTIIKSVQGRMSCQ